MQNRGLAADDAVGGGEMSSLKGFFTVIKSEPIFLNIGL